MIIEECSAMDYTSRQFRAFLQVAHHRSFSRAAESLYITPSGLSVLIRELEAHLGFRLFDRTTRHVGLTSYGQELLGVVRQSLEKVDATVSRIGRSASEAGQSFSVGAPPLIAANVLPEAIKEFRNHRPEMHIRVFDLRGEALTRLVEEGKLDMSLGAFFKPATGIRRTPLFRFSLMVIRPDNGPELRRASTTWSALQGEPLISLVSGNLVQQFIDKHLARAKVTLRPRAVYNYLDTMIAMVEAGEGVAVIPSYVLPACRNRKVVMSRLVNPVVNVDFSRVSLRGKKLPPGADDFTTFLQRFIARWAGRTGIL
jgi:LysR family transcriptional regulator, carnitine catabolism transcriptional activator